MELVDGKGLDARCVGGREHRLGADKLGDDAAPLYVAHEDDGQVGCFGDAHVGDVRLAQVDLCRASRALDQDQIGSSTEPSKTVHDQRQERPGIGASLPVYNYLHVALGLRLEQHRVHVRVGRATTGPGLQCLGAADLAAIFSDSRVVRQVLWLERGDGQAAAQAGPAQTGDDQGLAYIRGGALDHDGFCHGASP